MSIKAKNISQDELQSLVQKNPFKGIKDTPKSRLNVTFLKNSASTTLRFPYYAEDKTYKLLGRDTFQFIIGVSQPAASEFFAALNYVMPVAGIYLGTFFVSPSSRKILLGLTAAFGVMALIGIPSDLLTGRPMFLWTPYTVLGRPEER